MQSFVSFVNAGGMEGCQEEGLTFNKRRQSPEGATDWRIGREPYLLCMTLYGSAVSAT